MPLSQTERLARELIHYYLPTVKATYGIRPNWLTWPVTGNRLEIDIFLAEIKVGLEIDGIQHGRPIIGLQRDFAAFERQQARDLWKMEECRRLGIALHKLTIFDLTEQRFPTKLREIIASGQRNTQHNRALHDRLFYYADRLTYAAPPRQLYAQAEKLSRQRFRPPKPKRFGWWDVILRWLRPRRKKGRR